MLKAVVGRAHATHAVVGLPARDDGLASRLPPAGPRFGKARSAATPASRPRCCPGQCHRRELAPTIPLQGRRSLAGPTAEPAQLLLIGYKAPLDPRIAALDRPWRCTASRAEQRPCYWWDASGANGEVRRSAARPIAARGQAAGAAGPAPLPPPLALGAATARKPNAWAAAPPADGGGAARVHARAGWPGDRPRARRSARCSRCCRRGPGRERARPRARRPAHPRRCALSLPGPRARALARARAGAENVDPTGAVPSRARSQEAMAFTRSARRFNPTHKLDGFIAHYGRHYFAYCVARRRPRGRRRRGGRPLDGFTRLRDAGTWAEVAEKVSEGRPPLLLFFSSIETAPARGS